MVDIIPITNHTTNIFHIIKSQKKSLLNNIIKRFA